MSGWMQTKLLKMKQRKIKQKPKYAGPTKGWAHEYKVRAQHEPDLMRLFAMDNVAYEGDVTEASQNKLRDLRGMGRSIQRSSREEVLEKLNQLTEGTKASHHICLVNEESCKVFLFWTEEHYFFVKKTFTKTFKSQYFSSRDLAFKFYKRKLVQWRHTD